MFLEYGINDKGDLIRIDQVGRGRLAGVFCPYCRRPLIARKGKLKAPHFAHDGETCRAAGRADDTIALPIYDHFKLHLLARDIDTLRKLVHGEKPGWKRNDQIRLEKRGLITFNKFKGRSGTWEVTPLGKIPSGDLSLTLFNDLQEPMFLARHKALEASAYVAADSAYYDIAITDLRLYRAQWRRVLSFSLYFMEITHSDGMLHKIGVTSRTAEERAIEAAAELRAAGLEDVAIRVIETWPYRGNIELYFKYRYAAYQYSVGTLTEYFALPADVLNAVLLDLRAMKIKVPDELESGILAGEPAPVEAGQPPYFQRLPLKLWVLLSRTAEAGKAGILHAHPDYALIQDIYLSGQLSKPRPLFEPISTQGTRAMAVSTYGQMYVQRYGAWYQQQYADQLTQDSVDDLSKHHPMVK